ncbi:MAG: hypothetical protein V2A73_08395 [Pseudomonadota bacterium]
MRKPVVGTAAIPFLVACIGLLCWGEPLALAQKKRDNDKEQLAAEREEAAKQIYAAGRKAYNLGEFDRAITVWKEGYEKTDYPTFLFNIAQAYRQKLDYRSSVFFYKAFLRESPDASNRAEVEARIAELNVLLAAQQSAADAPPSTSPSSPSAPAAKVGSGADGQPAGAPDHQPETAMLASKEAARTGGLPGVRSEGAEEIPAVKTDRQGAGRKPRLKVVGLATAGGGAALFAAGVLLALHASSVESEVNGEATTHGTWSQDLQDKDAAARRASTFGIAALSAGSAAVLAGGVLYYLGIGKSAAVAETPPAVAVVPAVAPNSAALLVRLAY